MENISNRKAFRQGAIDGIPIGLGYFAVAFSIGIMARTANIHPLLGFFSSFFERASAGEYAVYSLMAVGAPYIEIFIISVIANARYLLMGTALTQKLAPDTPMHHRILVGCSITDEVFGISMAYEGYLNPFYTYGAIILAGIMWSLGTCIGIIAGSILPVRIVSALSVALYGMFLAIIIPGAKKDKAVRVAIIVSFITSYLSGIVPGIKELSSGTRVIILTVVISAAAALIKPHPSDQTEVA